MGRYGLQALTMIVLLGGLVDLGMSPLEAIRSATIVAAEVLALDDRGQVAEDLVADIIAVWVIRSKTSPCCSA